MLRVIILPFPLATAWAATTPLEISVLISNCPLLFTPLLLWTNDCNEQTLPAASGFLISLILYIMGGFLTVDTCMPIPDLGRFWLRSRNQTMIPTPIPESESFVVRFGGVGIGVGIVVIGIGVGIGIRWRFHTFMYTYHLTFIQEVTPRKLKALSHRVRNTARWKWICLFRVDCCAVCISMYSIQACQLILFNNGPQQLDFYFCSVHSKETVGLIGRIWPNWFNPVLWCYNAAK